MTDRSNDEGHEKRKFCFVVLIIGCVYYASRKSNIFFSIARVIVFSNEIHE